MKGKLATQVAAAVLLALPAAGAAAEKTKLNGYAEYRVQGFLVVDGQRVSADAKTRYKDEAKDIASIPLGYEVEVEGERQPDGSVLARKLKAKPNGNAMFESDLVQSFNQMEESYRKEGRMFEPDEQGGIGSSMGKLWEEGPEVRRVRRITKALVPSYLKPEDFRVYVVENQEWNAMAAPNRSIYVFSGLLEDMDDDEVAIVLGHELAHATHEHSRKQFKKQLIIQLAAAGVQAVAGEAIDGKGGQTAVQIAAFLGASAWSNGYGRSHEDQADRVGLRYAYEGGFDVKRGPGLWQRFEKKYGGTNKVVNFFFGGHSVARDRARNLERELAYNYH